jgi:2-polyprenyl-3-methyl-5-hydroxy-6-metoxy-1,4-benzoquinol methylase
MYDCTQASLGQLSQFILPARKDCADLAACAFETFIGHDLNGQRVLDIGAGSGQMSVVFATLGAEVTALDIDGPRLELGKALAQQWGVADRIRFLPYDGDPSVLPDCHYDLAFTKSVLLLIPDIELFLVRLAPKLRPGAKVVFLENARRNWVDVLVRRLVHACRREYSWRVPVYMTTKRIDVIRRIFDVHVVRKAASPLLHSLSSGWYLICGYRR